MAWIATKTWTFGELVTEDHFNDYLKTNFDCLKTSIDDNGRIRAISSSYFADLSGANLTGVAKTASGNSFTSGTHNFNAGTGTRIVAPVGTNKWAT